MSYAAAARECLAHALAPIAHILADETLTDMHIVAGGQAVIDRGSGPEEIDLPYSFADLEYIARLAAAATGQDIAPDVPQVSTAFPGGHRVHISRPPAVPDGQLLFSVRRPVADAWTLDQWVQAGNLEPGQAETIKRAIAARVNILFAGLVGSGKTTLMRGAIKEIPLDWRLVTVEDMRELIGLRHRNVSHLLYSDGAQGAAQTTAEKLVQGAMRMGMDGLLIQEVRDRAAYAYQGALKSGHWVMTTTHADSAEDAYPRLTDLVKEHPAGMHLDEAALTAALRRNIPVVVHCEREGKRRYVKEVLCTTEFG